MHYLHFILLLSFIIGSTILVWNYTKRLKRDYLRRIIEKNTLDARNNLPSDTPYSSETIIQVADWVVSLPSHKQNEFISILQQKKIAPVVTFLNQNKSNI